MSLLRKLRLGEVLGTSARLACVVGVAAECDIAREDAGLLAAIVMRLAVANMDGPLNWRALPTARSTGSAPASSATAWSHRRKAEVARSERWG